ncbi:MAG: hypothetical protein ACRD22_19780, partial [Terriglobia bacterium]
PADTGCSKQQPYAIFITFRGPTALKDSEESAVPMAHKQMLRGVYPERNTEILRFAQNDGRRAQHDISFGSGSAGLRGVAQRDRGGGSHGVLR